MPYLGTGYGGDVRRPGVYEPVEDMPFGATPPVGNLGRLGHRPDTVTGRDGGVGTGMWHWWVGASCRDADADRQREAYNAARVQNNLEPRPDYNPVDVAGWTCQPVFYPEQTLWPDGRARLQDWAWLGAHGGDRHGMRALWTVDFTPEEWNWYNALQSDEVIRTLPPSTALAIYYSVLQWRCTGDDVAHLQPSPISPQSLRDKFNTGEEYWLEYYEREVRNRIWRVRQDLIRIRLEDGTEHEGLRAPDRVEFKPHCVDNTTQIIQTIFSVVTAGVAWYYSIPTWMSLVWQIPQTIPQFRDMMRAGGLTRLATTAVQAQTGTGTPSATTPPTGTPAGPQTPTQALTNQALGLGPATVSQGGGGIGAAALLLLLLLL